jgi:arylsulfatase A-like enzyme
VLAWLAFLLIGAWPAAAQADDRPNILWISSEDNGPHLGAYGDPVARTPELDRLAARGVRYTRAWSDAPVCAPSRTAIITGVSPTTTGGMHMRSLTPLPSTIRMFPQLLRERGYYTTNHVKEDYNHPHTGHVWDESSNQAHWRHRAGDQPFFAVFNLTVTHESQIRARPHVAVTDPAAVRVPAYHPDAPEVRQDWAQYHDKMAEMDRQVGEHLRELEAAGLADSTIVFYWGDHGVGLPRGKRWLYAEGLDVPLIVHVPARYRHLAPEGYAPGAALDRLVTLMDLGPTVLSLAGVEPPAWMHGRALMGRFSQPAPEYIHAFRDRMDERYDMSRAIRDGRYLYIRNFMPHRAQGQYLAYMFETPTTQVWKARFDAGTLTPIQSTFWWPKSGEELYDLQADPDNVHNLAGSVPHAATVARMRGALRQHMLATRDLGLLPEGEMHARRGTRSPYELGLDAAGYPIARVLEMADLASEKRVQNVAALRRGLTDADAAVRYWAATGLLALGQEAIRDARVGLLAALDDPTPWPRVVAAEALTLAGQAPDRRRALHVLLDTADAARHGHHAAIFALNAVASLGALAEPIRDRAAAVPDAPATVPDRERDYVARLKTALLR